MDAVVCLIAVPNLFFWLSQLDGEGRTALIRVLAGHVIRYGQNLAGIVNPDRSITLIFGRPGRLASAGRFTTYAQIHRRRKQI